MMYRGTCKPSSWNPSTQGKDAQVAPSSAVVQAQQDSQTLPTQKEIENDAFQQNKLVASGLQLKQKSGTITPVEQETLGVLQAKMNDFWAQRVERESRFDRSFAKTPVHAPGQPGSAPIQPRLASTGYLASPIQTKLTIGQPHDQYEQEADRVASQVVQQINAPTIARPAPRQAIRPQETVLQRSPLLPALQRWKAPTNLESVIHRARGGGQPLEAGLQQSMGQVMAADFRGVRVHTDAQSDQLNRSIQAKAFTTGQDVFFRQGAYEPKSQSGQELIAHELTHVVQQNHQLVQQPARSPNDHGGVRVTKAGLQSLSIQTYKDKSKSVETYETFQPPIDQMSFEDIEAIKQRIENEEIELNPDEIHEIIARLEELESANKLVSEMRALEGFEWGKSTMTGPTAQQRVKRYTSEIADALKKPVGRQRDMAVSRAESVTTPLAKWLYADAPEPKVINCWEAVLIAAFRAGLIDKQYIKLALLHKGGRPHYVDVVMKNKTKEVKRPANKQEREIYAVSDTIPAGMVVAFGVDPGHIALATGKRIPIKNANVRNETGATDGNEILELDSGATGSGTVEEAMARNRLNYTAVITWGPLPKTLPKFK